MLTKIIHFCIAKPKTIFISFGILTLIALSQIPSVKQISDVSDLINKKEPIYVLTKKMEAVFGSTKFAFVTIENAFTVENLTELKRFEADLKSSEFVEEVTSIFSESFLKGDEDSFEVLNLVENEDFTVQSIIKLKQKLASFPIYQYSLYNQDAINMIVKVDSDATAVQTNSAILEKISGSRLKDQMTLSGWPTINNNIKRVMDQDLQTLIPLVFLVIIIIFFFLFRSIRGIIVPIITILIAILCTVGFMSLIGVSLNVVTNSIPILLVAIGTSDGIHYMTKYYYYRSQTTDHKELLVKATSFIGPTILLTSLTTMGGFLANLFSSVKSISEFGLVTAFGVLIAGIASYTLVPALLSRFKFPEVKKSKENRKSKMNFESLALRTFHFLQDNKLKVLFFVIIFTALNIYKMLDLSSNYSLLGYFDKQSAVVKDAQVIANNNGGLNEFSIVINTNKPNGVINAKMLKTIDDTIKKIKKNNPEDIKFITALPDFIKNMNKAYNGEEKYYRVPNSDDEVSQYLEVYSWSGDAEEDLKNVTNEDYSIARIYGRFTLNQDRAGNIQEKKLRYYMAFIDKVIAELKSQLGEEVEIYQYGELPIWSKTLTDIVHGQVYSVLIAMVIVFFITLPMLKSFILTSIALIPLALAIIVNFSFMSLFNIQLDIATSLVSAMAVGIGIDDALHFLLTYKKILEEKKDKLEALKYTMTITGKAIFATSATLVIGYSVFFVSSFTPINNFGLLNILTIIVATLATVIIIPLAIILIPINKQKVKS